MNPPHRIVAPMVEEVLTLVHTMFVFLPQVAVLVRDQRSKPRLISSSNILKTFSHRMSWSCSMPINAFANSSSVILPSRALLETSLISSHVFQQDMIALSSSNLVIVDLLFVVKRIFLKFIHLVQGRPRTQRNIVAFRVAKNELLDCLQNSVTQNVSLRAKIITS
jgi:hypothetical protein